MRREPTPRQEKHDVRVEDAAKQGRPRQSRHKEGALERRHGVERSGTPGRGERETDGGRRKESLRLDSQNI